MLIAMLSAADYADAADVDAITAMPYAITYMHYLLRQPLADAASFDEPPEPRPAALLIFTMPSYLLYLRHDATDILYCHDDGHY